jgi:hypothetical protein
MQKLDLILGSSIFGNEETFKSQRIENSNNQNA